MLAIPGIKGERTLLTNGLFQIVAEGTPDAEGRRRLALFNASAEYQFNVVYDFIEPQLMSALGETRVDGTKYAISVYPGETKEFVFGKYKGVKRQFNFGAPDQAWQDRKAQEIDKSVSIEMMSVKELLLRFPRADKKYHADYVAKLCEDHQTPFVDVTFQPKPSSLARDHEGKAPTYVWLRPASYCTGDAAPTLFVDKIEPNDIDQGSLGDCYLMCALACCSEFPVLVKDMFSYQQNPKLGIYRVRVCKNGWWQVVTVDDLLPINPVTRLPAYAKNREEPNELWVSIIEKAYAKLYGSYAAIRSGDPCHAIADLLGFPYERFNQCPSWQQRDRDEGAAFFDVLMERMSERCLITLGTPGTEAAAAPAAAAAGGAAAAPLGAGAAAGETDKQALAEKYKSVGLATNHAFSLLKVRQLPIQNGDFLRLCQIRNPWGHGTEWNGAWSDNSPMWTPELMDAVGFIKADDGTFWMEWSDVMYWFEGGTISHVLPQATQLRVAGNFEGGIPDVVIKLEVAKPLTMWFGCHQRDTRGLAPGDKDGKYCGVQVAIVQDKIAGSTVTTSGNVTTVSAAKSNIVAANGTGSYQSSRDTFGRAVELSPTTTNAYYILPQAFQDINKSFVLSFWLEDPSAISKMSFVSFADGAVARKRYNPASTFHSSAVPITVSAQYQLMVPNCKQPIEITSETVNFSPPIPRPTASGTKAGDGAAGGKAGHVDPNKLVANLQRMRLCVTVVSGSNLVAKDVGGTSDPYVTIGVFDGNGKRHTDVPEVSTRFIKNTLNPVWGEKFVFPVNATDILYVECWDRDVFGRDTMGHIRIPVNTLQLSGVAGEARREVRALKGGDATGEIEFLFSLA